MDKNKTKDIYASIRAKLKNIAVKSGRDFDAVLLQYFQERFLYRISVSEYKDNFVLKGALLLMVKSVSPFRPTKDVDFLGKGIDANPENLKSIVKKLAQVQCEDSVDFVEESIVATTIKEGAEYEGVRVKIEARLGAIKKILSLDIGFGDTLLGNIEEFDFPVLLNFPIPKVKCYPYESIIAEKFQAIVWLNFQTSRMKDFFDIIFLANVGSFQASRLKEALIITFSRRNTSLSLRKVVFSEEYKMDKSKQRQWSAFLRKHHLIAEPKFRLIIDRLENFLEPILGITFNEIENYIWDNERWQWKINA
ncbi:MAG: nucleotidyl transferase AbiEii/AbiGii toxin family protein [Candidatus Omnitrophota bacterium]